MNKTELIERMAEELGSKKDAQAAVEALLGALAAALDRGESVTLTGFGTFKTAERKARRGRNPRTGEEIDIPACRSVKFVPGKALREAVA